MKFLYILIIFALVNVLVAKFDEYVKQVLITNNHIKIAQNSMPKIIKHFLESYTIGEIYCMLSTPDTDNPYLEPHEMIEFQKMLQSEISAATGIKAPEMKEKNFVKLLEERRITTTTSLKNKITRESDKLRADFLTELRSARRTMTTEAIKSLISQNDQFFKDLNEMCRLVALFRSIKYPSSYEVDAAYTVVDGYCFIVDAMMISNVYTFIDGEIWEVQSNPANRTQIRSFYDELQD